GNSLILLVSPASHSRECRGCCSTHEHRGRRVSTRCDGRRNWTAPWPLSRSSVTRHCCAGASGSRGVRERRHALRHVPDDNRGHRRTAARAHGCVPRKKHPAITIPDAWFRGIGSGGVVILSAASVAATFNFHFGFKAGAIAKHRRDRELPAAAAVRDRAVVVFEPPVYVDRVPRLRMTDVVEHDVVVLTPEEGNGVEPLAAAENVTRRCLPLALGDDPMLHADALVRMRIG